LSKLTDTVTIHQDSGEIIFSKDWNKVYINQRCNGNDPLRLILKILKMYLCFWSDC
jgi:hypothetical protein